MGILGWKLEGFLFFLVFRMGGEDFVGGCRGSISYFFFFWLEVEVIDDRKEVNVVF